MHSVAIITARGGSKRIPRKNIKDFCGKPIIAYSIEAAKKSNLFEEVMVSTDDEEIAAVARSYGAAVPFMRSAKTSDDYATTAVVLQEVLSEYRKRDSTFDVMCCLYPTAPFVTGEKLKMAFDKFRESGMDGLVPVVRFSFPPQRCFVIDKGELVYKWPQYKNERSQDLEPFYHDAGQFYFWQVEAFLSKKERTRAAFLLDEMEVQDIDNLSDWALAEIKYQMLQERGLR